MSIADRIQTLRKSKGISQEELADKIGVSRQAVSKWESGQSAPDIEKIILNELIVDSAPLSVANLSAALRDVCDKKDLPCPIITETNLNNLINFNHTKFKQSDFLEKISFDYLEIGNIPK